MNDLIYVPLEPISERYSAQWYHNIPNAFRNAGFDGGTISGMPLLENEIKTGTFLDINSTVAYKMSQLRNIAHLFHIKAIKPDTIFFFSDIEFWGIESVRLMSQMNDVPIKMCGFLHAASYTREDAFSVAAPYQQFTELGWIAAMDKVFVGSNYHRNMVIQKRIPFGYTELENKIHVTGNPLFFNEYKSFDVKKKKKILLTNRFDQEKRPLATLALFKRLKREFPEWEFVVTSSRKRLTNNPVLKTIAETYDQMEIVEIKTGLTKDQYHQELAEAAIVVSHSIEENYGYCIAEALIYGALPLLREGLSHDEFLRGDKRFSFNLEQSPDDDYKKAKVLIESFDTAEWPATPPIPIDGMQKIVEHVLSFNEEST